MVLSDGRVALFSCEDFVSRLCQGDACLICGASPSERPFNDEHIVPRWVLRRYGLFDKEITLPTKERRRYGGYRVQCCASCNTLLGDRVETPVSALLDGEYEVVSARLTVVANRELIFKWLVLLFLKTHLKDQLVPVHKDKRRGSGVIGDIYDWSTLHHLHAIARSPYTGAHLLPGVVGSLCVYEVDDPISADDFDYLDLSFMQTIAVRLGRVGIVAVLNDGGLARDAWSHRLDRINGPITGSQFREVAARLAVANDDLIDRPTFGTFITEHEKVLIFAGLPKSLEIDDFDPVKLGEALHYSLGSSLGTIEIDGSRDPHIVSEAIRSGRVSFLFNEEGEFRPHDTVFRRETPI